MHRKIMGLVVQFCIDALHIMIVDEIIQFNMTGNKIICSFYRMRDFKIIVVIMAAVQSFMQGIIGNAVQGVFICPPGIIAVDHFAHQPEIRLKLVRLVPKHVHEFKVQHIRRIQTDTVDIKFFNPETDHIADVLLYGRISLVQLYKKIIAAPVIIGEAVIVLVVSIEIDVAVPIPVS